MSTTLNMPIQCQLKDLLEERGLTQMDLVRDLSLSPTTVGKLYNNKSEMIAFSTIEKLCNYFKVGIEDLLVITSKIDS